LNASIGINAGGAIQSIQAIQIGAHQAQIAATRNRAGRSDQNTARSGEAIVTDEGKIDIGVRSEGAFDHHKARCREDCIHREINRADQNIETTASAQGDIAGANDRRDIELNATAGRQRPTAARCRVQRAIHNQGAGNAIGIGGAQGNIAATACDIGIRGENARSTIRREGRERNISARGADGAADGQGARIGDTDVAAARILTQAGNIQGAGIRGVRHKKITAVIVGCIQRCQDVRVIEGCSLAGNSG